MTKKTREISIKKSEKVTVVEIKGRLDTTNYLTLESNLNQMIQAGERNLLIDCINLDYVSSSGLRVFLVALKKLNQINGKFVMCNLQENIQEIFEISGFISIFQVFSSKEEAMQACLN
ncbi:MAG: STAS domain-containing protein [Salinivirgaceae bacterium]